MAERVYFIDGGVNFDLLVFINRRGHATFRIARDEYTIIMRITNTDYKFTTDIILHSNNKETVYRTVSCNKVIENRIFITFVFVIGNINKKL